MRRVASSDADRLTALLRLLAAPVVLAGEAVSSAAPERAETITTLVALLAGYALVVLFVVRRPTRPALLDVLLPLIDTAFAVALGLASGGVFSVLFVVFLFAPATTAFQLRPRLTLATFFTFNRDPNATKPVPDVVDTTSLEVTVAFTNSRRVDVGADVLRCRRLISPRSASF